MTTNNKQLLTNLLLKLLAINGRFDEDNDALDSLKQEVRKEIDSITDADRYRWLKKQRKLLLETDGSTWKREGVPFVASHRLASEGTQWGAYETLDELIDSAMLASEAIA